MIVTRYEADEIEDPYSYRGTACLKNKLGLRDPIALQAFELEMSSVRSLEPLPAGQFGPTHYRRVHRHLFQDVYRWAGRYRTIRTGKGQNWFCLPQFIDAQMNRLFPSLKTPAFVAGNGAEAFVAAAAEFLSTLNAIHPFREGNGRSQLSFLHLIALRAGHPLRLENIQQEAFLDAMIRSFDGPNDLLIAQLRSLLS